MKKLFTLTFTLLLLAAATNIASAEYYGESYVYSHAFDGFTSIYSSPSTKSTKIGKLPNGDAGAEFIEVCYEDSAWYYINFRGITGYVKKENVDWMPSESVNLNITAKWLYGVWHDGQGNTLTLDKAGNFMIRGEQTRAGKWKLSGGNDLTLTGNYQGWKQTYVVDLEEEAIGHWIREGATIPVTRSMAVNTSYMNDRQLSQVFFRSEGEPLPAEFKWIEGEWHVLSKSCDYAKIEADGLKAFNSLDNNIQVSGYEEKPKSGYTIGYKYNNDLKNYYIAIIPNGTEPVIYIDQTEHKLYLINNGEARELTRTGDIVKEQKSDYTNIMLMAGAGIIVVLLIVIVILIVRLSKRNK